MIRDLANRASGNRPFELAAFIVCGLLGLSYWLNFFINAQTAPPATVEVLMPHYLLYTWYALLFFGGITGTFSLYMRSHKLTGLFVERAALVAIGSALFMYSIALFYISGLAALGSGSVLCAWGLACVVRILAIPDEVRQTVLVSEIVKQLEDATGDE